MRGGIKELKLRLRELCFYYRNQLNHVSTLQDQYNLIYDAQEHAKREFSRKLKTRDVIYEIGKVFGVSTQTVYRAKAAVRSCRTGLPPKKYAIRTYSNLKHNKKRSI
ncbi:hypothetical protein SDC9_20245 [bioreactor metagenome]|uniref:Uncharacterized protein n=1 Tax=bioreactor metagenome TaxID=1076179 RepID=A0A644U653_9ZZZZ